MGLGLNLGLGLGFSTPSAGGGGGVAAVTLNPTSGTNKYSGIVLSNGNLTMADSGANSGLEFVRATREAAAGAVEFEVTYLGGNGKFCISVENGSQSYTSVYGDADIPGGGNNPTTGYSAILTGGTMYFVYNGGAQNSAPITIATNDVFTVRINKAAGTISVLYNGVQKDAATGLSFSQWNASVASISTGTGSLRTNFAGAFTYGANGPY
jgi:hypothetical protein